MTLVYSPTARRELERIYDFNVERYGAAHAARYEDSLLDRIDRLGDDWAEGRPFRDRPYLRRLSLRRGSGDGHVAVYEVDESAGVVDILHVFHTKQDIEGRLGRER